MGLTHEPVMSRDAPWRLRRHAGDDWLIEVRQFTRPLVIAESLSGADIDRIIDEVFRTSPLRCHHGTGMMEADEGGGVPRAPRPTLPAAVQ
jgi:hypothetical protein